MTMREYKTPEPMRTTKREYERNKRHAKLASGEIVGKRPCLHCAGMGHSRKTCPELVDADEPKPATLTKAWHLLAAVYRGRCKSMESELRWWRDTYGAVARRERRLSDTEEKR